MRLGPLSLVLLVSPVLALACSGASESAVSTPALDGGGGGADASTTTVDASAEDSDGGDAGGNGDDAGDAGAPLATCAADDFAAPDMTCLTFTAVESGLSAAGANATDAEIAVRPATHDGKLVLFLAGSGGSPSGAFRASARKNLYAAAAADGHAALGVTYANDAAIGAVCYGNDACFFPTRQSVILGKKETGSALDVTLDEGIVGRAAAALRTLAARDPAGGWGAFLGPGDPGSSPATALAWSKILVVGHSQGGGHAAAIGKLVPVARVVQLSSTCDGVGTVAASWTNGAVGTWASPPSQFRGLAAPTVVTGDGTTGDTTCPLHAANWANLGMLPANRHDDAATCGAQGNTHGASIGCVDNYPTWVALLQ